MTSRALSGVDALLAAGAEAGPVLGLCSGTPVLSLGVVKEGRIAAHLARALSSHGSGLAAAVEEVLDAAQVTLSGLKGVAIGLGPGSFTGLRIGLAYAKGLTMACGVPIAGVASLDAMALSAAGRRQQGVGICALRDARRGEVYAALYRIVANGLEKLTEDMVVSLEDLVRGIEGEVLFVGDAKAVEARSLFGARGGNAQVTEANPTGAMIAAIGAGRLAAGNMDRAASLEPIYLRPGGPAAKSNITSLSIDGREGDGIWSAGKKNSSGGMRPTTRN